MHRALRELVVDGVETSRDFHLRVMEDEEYRRGDVEIQWLERRLPTLTAVKPPGSALRAAAVAAALFAERDRGSPRAAAPAAAAGGGTGAPTQSPAETEWARAARREALRGW
jgi:acetyl-CoA carboxylase biotin carboxylase subunit